jgi:hypothetical protein
LSKSSVAFFALFTHVKISLGPEAIVKNLFRV